MQHKLQSRLKSGYMYPQIRWCSDVGNCSELVYYRLIQRE